MSPTPLVINEQFSFMVFLLVVERRTHQPLTVVRYTIRPVTLLLTQLKPGSYGTVVVQLVFSTLVTECSGLRELVAGTYFEVDLITGGARGDVERGHQGE